MAPCEGSLGLLLLGSNNPRHTLSLTTSTLGILSNSKCEVDSANTETGTGFNDVCGVDAAQDMVDQFALVLVQRDEFVAHDIVEFGCASLWEGWPAQSRFLGQGFIVQFFEEGMDFGGCVQGGGCHVGWLLMLLSLISVSQVGSMNLRNVGVRAIIYYLISAEVAEIRCESYIRGRIYVRGSESSAYAL